ncbi:DUF4097 family beta strand repeat-containing protein [Fulvivirga sp.]|uniref:DUF4097 family beta strand repeat-containing protein n=1 Tax=Fulvivirga sp. TaxID=1931237 RepID=UPI0032EABA7B
MKLKITTMIMLLASSLMAQQKIEKEFSGVNKINMSTSSGDCLLKKGNTDKVLVTVEYTYDSDDYAPEFEQNGTMLRIKEDFNGRGSFRGESTWTLTVPDDMDIKFNTGSGDFEASDLKLELSLNAGSGDFVFDNINGEITSNAGSGNMRMRGFSGELRANTGSGNVRVSGSKGEIKINTGSGNIDINDVSGAISANVGSGDIDARGILVSESSGFNSGSGDVIVELAGALKADISLNSGSGNSKLDFNGNAIEGLVEMRANKKNGTIKAPFDFDSTEELDNYGSQKVIKKTAQRGSSDIKIKIGTGSGTASITE